MKAESRAERSLTNDHEIIHPQITGDINQPAGLASYPPPPSASASP